MALEPPYVIGMVGFIGNLEAAVSLYSMISSASLTPTNDPNIPYYAKLVYPKEALMGIHANGSLSVIAVSQDPATIEVILNEFINITGVRQISRDYFVSDTGLPDDIVDISFPTGQ